MPSKSVTPFARVAGPQVAVQAFEPTAVKIARAARPVLARREAMLLSQRVQRHLACGKDVVIDFSYVKDAASTCISELVFLSMKAHAAGREILLAAPSVSLLDRLCRTNVASLFEVHPSVDEAVASLQRRSPKCLIQRRQNSSLAVIPIYRLFP